MRFWQCLEKNIVMYAQFSYSTLFSCGKERLINVSCRDNRAHFRMSKDESTCVGNQKRAERCLWFPLISISR